MDPDGTMARIYKCSFAIDSNRDLPRTYPAYIFWWGILILTLPLTWMGFIQKGRERRELMVKFFVTGGTYLGSFILLMLCTGVGHECFGNGEGGAKVGLFAIFVLWLLIFFGDIIDVTVEKWSKINWKHKNPWD